MRRLPTLLALVALIAIAGADIQRETRRVSGWTVHVNRELLDKDPKATARALELLKTQLDEIVRVVPAKAVKDLRKVQLWFSPEYPSTPPRAEYHPSAGWLTEHARDPSMAKGIEFTNIRIFELETRRMPNFALHELAHAYQDRVLKEADSLAIKEAFEKAKADGKYDNVEVQDANGKRSNARAYAMTNPQEYFAETTEAFFSRNDFYPFNRAELKQADPGMAALLAKLWGVK